MIRVIKDIIFHPLNKKRKLSALLTFLFWQIRSRFFNKKTVIDITEKSKLNVIKGRTSSTGMLYCGLFEFEDQSFLLHFLREDDLFVDVGANIGVYTILSSAHCKSKSISIEPIPNTIGILKSNIKLNNIENLVTIKPFGISEKPGKMLFTNSHDSINHVKSDTDVKNESYIKIKTNSLDEIIGNNSPIMLKIDVEGFEKEVVSGGINTLSNLNLKAIIIELNGCGSNYGYDDSEINSIILNYGFKPYVYNPYSRVLSFSKYLNSENTLYIRDIDFVQKRLINSKKFKIFNYNI